MIQVLGGRQLLKMWKTAVRIRKVVIGECRMNLKLTENQLHVNPERIWQIVDEGLREKDFREVVSHSVTDEQKENGVAVCENFIQTC